MEAELESSLSDRSRGVALALAAILGPFGAHRFYVGKTGTGILMLFTLGGASPRQEGGRTPSSLKA